MPKRFKITAKFNNLWAFEQLTSKANADKRLSLEIKDNWTIYIYGDHNVKGLLDEAKEMVSSSYGYVDAVETLAN